jgi:5-methylcytosine-specific restriction endonuclease McrA
MKAKRSENPQAHRDSVKRSTQKHYAKKLERNNAYRKLNPEKVSQWKKQDRITNKTRVLSDNAMRRSLINDKTTSEIRQLYALRDFYKAMSLGDDFHVDHIIPLSKNGRHVIENLQIIPAIDNLRKGANL